MSRLEGWHTSFFKKNQEVKSYSTFQIFSDSNEQKWMHDSVIADSRASVSVFTYTRTHTPDSITRSAHTHTHTRQHMFRNKAAPYFTVLHIPNTDTKSCDNVIGKRRPWEERKGEKRNIESMVFTALRLFHFYSHWGGGKNKQEDMSVCEWVCGCESKKKKREEEDADKYEGRGIGIDKERGAREGEWVVFKMKTTPGRESGAPQRKNLQRWERTFRSLMWSTRTYTHTHTHTQNIKKALFSTWKTHTKALSSWGYGRLSSIWSSIQWSGGTFL